MPAPEGRGAVVELVRTNDVVLLSWLTAALADERISTIVLDAHMSVMNGSISAIPRRVMVSEDDLERARRVLAEGDALARGERG